MEIRRTNWTNNSVKTKHIEIFMWMTHIEMDRQGRSKYIRSKERRRNSKRQE